MNLPNHIAIIMDGNGRWGKKKFNNRNSLIDYMTKNPHVVNINMPASKALAIMNEKKITSLLVVKDKDMKKKSKKLLGIIHIHSLLKKGF